MDAPLAGLFSAVEKKDREILADILSYNEDLRKQPWCRNKDLVEAGHAEGRKYMMFFLSRLTRDLTKALPGLQNSLLATMTLADPARLSVIQSLFCTAYLRGVKRALEITGTSIPMVGEQVKFMDEEEEAEEASSHTDGETCGDGFSGRNHTPQNEATEPPPSNKEIMSLLDGLDGIRDLMTLLNSSPGSGAGIGSR